MGSGLWGQWAICFSLFSLPQRWRVDRCGVMLFSQSHALLNFVKCPCCRICMLWYMHAVAYVLMIRSSLGPFVLGEKLCVEITDPGEEGARFPGPPSMLL